MCDDEDDDSSFKFDIIIRGVTLYLLYKINNNEIFFCENLTFYVLQLAFAKL